MKKGTTATIKVDLQLEGVQKIIFTFNNSDATTTEPTLQKVFPGNDVRHEDDGYYIGLNQTDTEKLNETFYLEAQVNFIGGAVTKSLIKKVKMPHTLFTEKLTQSASNGEEVDVELETESVVETVSVDYGDLENKPQINNITLIGNKTAHDLGLATPDDLAQALADYQLKITSNNKLDADLVNDEESENKFTNETEKTKWNAEATIFDAIYNNGQIVKTTSSYPNIKKNDLIIDTDVANNPQTSVKIWRVKFTPSTTLELELLSGIVVINDTPPTEQYGSSGIYTVDQIVFSKNGNFYRCATATRGQGNLYTYTWQTYDIKNKTRAYPAVVSGGQVSFLEADYPGIKAGDTIYYNTGGDSKNKQWIVVYTTTTLQVMDCEEIGFITGTPPTTVQARGTQYMVDKIYFSDNGNIYRCLTKTPNGQITGYDYTWQTFDGHDTKYSASIGLSLNNGAFSVDNPLPSSAQADSGKFLRVGASGSPEWQLVANAEDNSY